MVGEFFFIGEGGGGGGVKYTTSPYSNTYRQLELFATARPLNWTLHLKMDRIHGISGVCPL